jgi:hypothetical protein
MQPAQLERPAHDVRKERSAMTTRTRLSSPHRILSGWVCACALILAGNAHAALIPAFGLEDFPNFEADSLVVGYDSDSDMLLAVGINNVTLFLGEESGINGLDGTGFRLNLANPANTLNGAGASGTISITGEIPELGFTSGTLITGDVTQFGWVEQDDPDSPYELQIVFAITGGDAAGLFGATGAIGFAQTDFPGLWTEDWINSGDGISVTADYAPVPVPGALLLFGSALLGLARRRVQPTR